MISDRRGFEHVELGPVPLPGSPPQYLDAPPPDERLSHGFERIEVDSRALVKYARYRRINPNDSASNRGAYVAVGFVAARALPLHVAANCIDRVSEIFGRLSGFLGPDDRFASDFKLGGLTYGLADTAALLESRCSPLVLLDVLMQGMKGHGRLRWKPGRPIFIGPGTFGDDAERDAHLHYFKSGAAGAITRFDQERERIAQSTQRLLAAADRADRLQQEWLAYESAIAERLPSLTNGGAELRSLIEELEQSNRAADALPPARQGFALSSRADRRGRRGTAGDRSVGGEGPLGGRSASQRADQRPPGPFGPRGRHAPRRQRRIRPSVPLIMVAGGALCTTIVVLALLFVLDGPPAGASSGGTDASAAAPAPADPPVDDNVPLDSAEQQVAGPQSEAPRDIARERAAIGSAERN